jgi:alkylmercury lyase-like protein
MRRFRVGAMSQQTHFRWAVRAGKYFPRLRWRSDNDARAKEYHSTSMFPLKTAAELMDREFVNRWVERGTLDVTTRRVLRTIIERFAAEDGPLNVESVIGAADGRESGERAVAELDEKDLILVRDRQVVLAYPFASTPLGFCVALADGRTREACCAIDALGMPALLRQPAVVHSRCHHCSEAIDVRLAPDASLDNGEVMAWVGRREDVRAKACASL